MQAFELCFNPKKRDDLFLTSFVYEPANIYEQRLGNLYMVGELTQAMPQNSHFLNNLASVIKKEYYSGGLKKSCEASLQEALKKGNEFLDQESKNGNVDWLGNLNLGVISFKDPVLNFAKVGDIKIFLARANELMDISQNLETGLPGGNHPNPLKVFGSMAEGKLAQEDKIIILSKRILSAFGKKQNFIKEISKVSDEKGLKQVLKNHQEVLAGLSGTCLFLLPAGDNSKQTLTWEKSLPAFSFSKNLVKPVVQFFKKIRLPHFKSPKVPRIPAPHMPKIVLPKLPKINLVAVRKKIFLAASLVLVLLAFYYIFQGERVQELRDAQMKLTEARSKAMLAESLLILKEDDKAKALFKETLNILSPLTKRGSPLRDDALFLQNSVKQRLK